MTNSQLGHIGRYELISRLGAGGMGEVFLARARGAGGFEKQVVIKRILPHLASDTGFVQRFIEEGKLVVKLRHASIAQVLDMGEHEGTFFIALEHVDGKDLAELLRTAKAVDKPLSVPLAVYVLGRLLEALDYAHSARDGDKPLGIIHRDVSPSNVLVSSTGEVKLVDFGIARATERIAATTTGAIRGKYGYMSPQQAAGADLDARSDLFSVGVVAWELLSGARPFDGASDLLTLDRVRFHDPGPLSVVAPLVPQDLSRWVGKLLSKSPDERFASADEALRALREHVIESRNMVGARELGEWVAQVVSALPTGLRNKSTAGMSLDDVLRLGLGSNPAGQHTMDAAPRTPSASRPPPPARPLTPAPAAAPAPATLTPLPPAAEPEPRSKRPTIMIALVATNVVLIAVVLFVLLRDNGSPKPEPTTPPTKVATTSEPDTLVAETQVAAIEVSAPEPVTAGAAFGEALGGVQVPAEVIDEVEVVVKTKPGSATVTIEGLGVLDRDKPFKVARGTKLAAVVSHAEHKPRRIDIVAGEPPELVVLEKKEPERKPMGYVAFRVRPATAVVKIDGSIIDDAGTTKLTLEAREHLLTVEIDGVVKHRQKFAVVESQTTNLQTIDVSGM